MPDEMLFETKEETYKILLEDIKNDKKKLERISESIKNT